MKVRGSDNFIRIARIRIKMGTDYRELTYKISFINEII